MSEIDPKTRNRNRLVLVGLAIMFTLPIAASIYLNSAWSDWAPAVTRNHGELIQPVLRVPGASERWESQSSGRWTLLVAADECRQPCRNLMAEISNVHRALGRRADRVRRVLLVNAAGEPPLQVPDLEVAIDGESGEFLTRALGADTALVLIDPLGNVMMRYPDGFDRTGLRKDLERLLKYSKVGT